MPARLFNIAGTTDDTMYATRRFGKIFSYAIPILAGDYKVNLLFADESFTAGGRMINISAEGKTIFRASTSSPKAGKGAAIDESFDVDVTDGTLNLAFLGMLKNATLSAIEVVPFVSAAR